MNTQEAIKILRNTAWLGTHEDREKTEQAIEVVAEALEHEQNCVKCKHYTETEDDTGVHSQCKVTCSNNAQVERLRKAAEETEDNGVRKGILKAIEVLEGDTGEKHD